MRRRQREQQKNPVCKTYDAKLARQLFWRGLRADEVASYAQRIKDYNAQVAKYAAELRAARKKDSVPAEKWDVPALPSDLRLLRHVAGATTGLPTSEYWLAIETSTHAFRIRSTAGSSITMGGMSRSRPC